MARLRVAFILPAGLLGGITLSAALLVGQVEIQQLRPVERRTEVVVETVRSPFQVIKVDDVPEPASSRESVPSPSDAVAPAPGFVAPTAPVDVPPLPQSADVPAPPNPVALLPTPADVTEPSRLRTLVNDTTESLPAPLDAVVDPVVDTVWSTAAGLVDGIGLVETYRESGEQVRGAADEAGATATAPVDESRQAADEQAGGEAEAVPVVGGLLGG